MACSRAGLWSDFDRDPVVDAVVTTGGTGISPRDHSYEAVDGLLERRLDGFGEAFRRLSWADVGPRAILSRALAGTFAGKIVSLT
jgi:molybdenum cofactor biosynthesis protein B